MCQRFPLEVFCPRCGSIGELELHSGKLENFRCSKCGYETRIRIATARRKKPKSSSTS
jgi:DNA-directed RNA polymerase subunit M/transcription elongation factor TFIIS